MQSVRLFHRFYSVMKDEKQAVLDLKLSNPVMLLIDRVKQ